MSSKQKIAISAIGIVLVLAVIGLTIGLVLVASSASAQNSMTVTYRATNVACTIQGSATGSGLTQDSITATHTQSGYDEPTLITANATDAAATGSIQFSAAEITDANGYVVYKFVITNTAAATSTVQIYGHAAIDGATINNMRVVMGTGETADALVATATNRDAAFTAVTSADTAAIAATESANLFVVIAVDDTTSTANFAASGAQLVITVDQNA